MSQELKVSLYGYVGMLSGFIVGFCHGLAYQDSLDLWPMNSAEALLLGLQPLGHASFFALVGWLLPFGVAADQFITSHWTDEPPSDKATWPPS